ncbi:MAG: hypothetical protein ACRD5H_00190 [Nitrososphaerales archaeon]
MSVSTQTSLTAAEKLTQRTAILERLWELKRTNQLAFYQPVSPSAAKIHQSVVKQVLTIGGNRSSKSDTHLVEAAIQMTGIVPKSLESIYPKEKLKPPIRVRLVCKSLLNTWDSVLKPKLQWWQWNGREPQGGLNGHWGWIPLHMLKGGDWAKSWSEKHRTLELVNGSTLQVMSYDQDLMDFSGGSFHLVLEDEGPPKVIHRENLMRTIDTNGRVMIAMTPPDEESTSWDAAWVYDDLYLHSQDPDIDVFTLFTEQNRILDRADIALIAKNLTATQRLTRLQGQFMHLGGRIYPLFTKTQQNWCYSCAKVCFTLEGQVCAECGGRTVEFCHVVDDQVISPTWPVFFGLDPHPRKPHAMLWVAIDHNDDPWVVAEGSVDGSPTEVKTFVDKVEAEYHLNVVTRIIDPNMGHQADGTTNRAHTVQEAFDAAGLYCSEANDNRYTARATIIEWLKPNRQIDLPRLRVFRSCVKTIFELEHYSWDTYARYSEDRKDPKQVPQDKHSDFPTVLGYIANERPVYHSAAEIIQRLKDHRPSSGPSRPNRGYSQRRSFTFSGYRELK